MDVNKLFSGIKIGDIAEKISNFFKKMSGWILLVIFLSLVIYCGYLWYSYVLNPKWEESKRQEYIGTKEKEAVFNKSKFDAIISEIENRRTESGNKIENVPDVFRLKQ